MTEPNASEVQATDYSHFLSPRDSSETGSAYPDYEDESDGEQILFPLPSSPRQPPADPKVDGDLASCVSKLMMGANWFKTRDPGPITSPASLPREGDRALQLTTPQALQPLISLQAVIRHLLTRKVGFSATRDTLAQSNGIQRLYVDPNA